MQTKEQQFGQQVFKAFRTNDEALWQSLQPTNEEYKALLQCMLDAKMEGLTQEKIDEMIGERKKEAAARYKADFEEFQAEASRAGVNWSTAVYQNFDCEAVYPTNFHRKYLNGVIWFAAKGGHFVIEDIEAVEIPAGYKLQAIKRLRKVEESD